MYKEEQQSLQFSNQWINLGIHMAYSDQYTFFKSDRQSLRLLFCMQKAILLPYTTWRKQSTLFYPADCWPKTITASNLCHRASSKDCPG